MPTVCGLLSSIFPGAFSAPLFFSPPVVCSVSEPHVLQGFVDTPCKWMKRLACFNSSNFDSGCGMSLVSVSCWSRVY